jgi:acyl dehydratase
MPDDMLGRSAAAGARSVDARELESLVGERLGHSPWYTIDQDRIDAFAEATEDRQWIHTDPVRAADGPFGTTIAHGYLTLSLAAVMTSDVLAITGVASAVNYGIDRVRFKAPVPSGSRLRAAVDLARVRPRPGDRLEMVTRLTFEIEGADAIAGTAETITLLQLDAD